MSLQTFARRVLPASKELPAIHRLVPTLFAYLARKGIVSIQRVAMPPLRARARHAAPARRPMQRSTTTLVLHSTHRQQDA
jgi:hypothetical protein